MNSSLWAVGGGNGLPTIPTNAAGIDEHLGLRGLPRVAG